MALHRGAPKRSYRSSNVSASAIMIIYDSGHLYGAAITNDHYGISLTNESWVRAQLLQHVLELVAYETRSWDDHHDVLVARLPPTR